MLIILYLKDSNGKYCVRNPALDSVARSLLLYAGLQQVRFPNISQLIGNSLIQKFLFPAVRLFRLFSAIPSADRSPLRANVSGLLMNNIRYKIKSWKIAKKMRKRGWHGCSNVILYRCSEASKPRQTSQGKQAKRGRQGKPLPSIADNIRGYARRITSAVDRGCSHVYLDNCKL